jgi:hypothetical protein
MAALMVRSDTSHSSARWRATRAPAFTRLRRTQARCPDRVLFAVIPTANNTQS